MLSIMDRITLLDIEINTLFTFAYNLFFVYFIAVLAYCCDSRALVLIHKQKEEEEEEKK